MSYELAKILQQGEEVVVTVGVGVSVAGFLQLLGITIGFKLRLNSVFCIYQQALQSSLLSRGCALNQRFV